MQTCASTHLLFMGFFLSPDFAFRHNEASAEKFLRAVIRTGKRCRVGVGEWQRFMDPLRHGDLRDHPECLWEAAPLAWPDLSGLLLPHRFQQHVSDQQAEPAQAALTETHGPGLPAHHGLHPQVAVVARGSQFWPALLLPTVHLSQQHKSCLQCYSGFPAAEALQRCSGQRGYGRNPDDGETEQHLRWNVPLVFDVRLLRRQQQQH